MRRGFLFVALALAVVFTGSIDVSAQEGKFAIGAKAGTLGFGAEIIGDLHPKVNVRASGNFFPYSYDSTESGVRYNIDLKLRSGLIALDFHPTGGGIRLSGGLLINGNQLDMDADVGTQTFSIGDQTYTVDKVGTLKGKVDFKSIAPFFGIGFGNAVGEGKRIGFNLELGIALQGSPTVDLDATGGLLASDTAFLAELAQEERQLEDDISFFDMYPVIAIGITFRP